MAASTSGLHHVTATVADAQADLNFYRKLLGLRLVKQTVNFDDPGVYHLYYGNRRGEPGTLMTTFPYAGRGMRTGTSGAGQVTAVAFSAPADAMAFWRERLTRVGVVVRDVPVRFGEEVMQCEDPSGVTIEIVGTRSDPRAPWTIGDVEPDVAIRGLHSVTLTIHDAAPTEEVLQSLLGFQRVAAEGGRRRLTADGASAGHLVDVLHDPEAPPGRGGMGTVHHVAFTTRSESDQNAIREKVLRHGLHPTTVRDRSYFRSIYFREPGGVLFEVATQAPGFLIDEQEATLGETLKLPPLHEAKREEIASSLPRIRR